MADALLAAAVPLHLRRGEYAYRQGENVEQTGRAFFGVAAQTVLRTEQGGEMNVG